MELTSAQFFSTLFAAVNLFYPENVDPSYKPTNIPQNELLEKYSFVIVGAGAAGCVLANRLTENSEWTVLLIEAGVDEDIISDTPLMEMINHNSHKDWNYTTVEQKKACRSKKGKCEYPRGHVMGGSTTINGMMYVRGHKADHDAYAKLGIPNWSYDDVLPYYIKSENNTERDLASSPYHGTSGPFNIQYPRYNTHLRDEYIKAGKEMGWVKKDYNAKYYTNVIDYVQFAMDGPSRESVSKGFLNPIKHRKNLHIIKGSVATKVLMEGKTSVGVEYRRDGQTFNVFAEKEVILSAGAIDTPKLLMLSGIGPKEELDKHEIDVKADLPVGKGLQDHLFIPFRWELTNASTITTDIWKTNNSIIEYAKYRKGPLTTSGGEAMSFFNTFSNKEPPNVQLMFHSFTQEMEKSQTKNLVQFLAALVHPKSVGSVRLKSSDFRDPPLIDPNYFGEDIDLITIEKAVQTLFKFLKTPTMRKYSPKLYQDHQPLCKGKRRREIIRCTIINYSHTIYHPVATARMGAEGDKKAVVTPYLKVRGLDKLRVIDASVIPFVPRANTMAAAIMVGEKGADIIKSEYQAQPQYQSSS